MIILSVDKEIIIIMTYSRTFDPFDMGFLSLDSGKIFIWVPASVVHLDLDTVRREEVVMRDK